MSVVHTDRRGLPDCVHQIVSDKVETQVDGTKNGTSYRENTGNKKSWSKEGLERFNTLLIHVLCNCQEHGATFDTDFLEEMKFRYASGIDAASGQSPEDGEVIPVTVSRPTIVYDEFDMELLLLHANLTGGGTEMNGEQEPDNGICGVSV
jgi:hypothetical protein